MLLIALLALAGISAVRAQKTDSQYFPQYGHWVRGEFLQMYQSASDPERIFGEPITAVFPDRLRPGIQVQYFERA
ncbi:MAG TPA: hypothetical protein VF806_05760, partial [Anaerolineaceae bacterium]